MSDLFPPPSATEPPPGEAAVFRKVAWRLLPFLFLLYVINLIDRANIGIARLQMVDDQHLLDEEAYGLGAGIFYLGYLLFEVPSNLILMRMGARRWLARIMVSWGIISASMMLMTGPWSFTLLRVLLGFAEAGFFPGIIYYLNDWFPARRRARTVALFMIGSPVASMIGNPLSGLILQGMDGVMNLWGWQWVFLLEGIPAVVLGFIALVYLTDRPEHAAWLTPSERAWLVQQLATERAQLPSGRRHSLAAAVVDPRVWLLIAVYFTAAMGDNSYSFYLPTFLKAQFPEAETFEIGLLAAVPGMMAMVGMVLVGRHSDRTGERRWHVALSAFGAAFGWLLMVVAALGIMDISNLGLRWIYVAGLAVALTGQKSMLPTFWTLPPTFLTGTAAAGGIALINSVANIGGLLGPTIMGHVKATSGSFTVGYLIMTGTLFLGGLLVLQVRSREQGRNK